jgi:hypothetical protein
MSTVLGEQPFKVASHERRPQLVLVGDVELIAAWVIPFCDFPDSSSSPRRLTNCLGDELSRPRGERRGGPINYSDTD